MNNLSFKGHWPGRKGTYINLLEPETAWKACQSSERKSKKVVSFQIANTIAVSYLCKEDSTPREKLNDLVRNILLRCHKDRVMVCLEYLHGIENFRADAPVQRQGSSGVEPMDPCLSQTSQMVGNSSSSLGCKQKGIQSAPLLQSRSLRQESLRKRCPEGGMARRPMVGSSSLKYNTASPGKAGKMGELIMVTPFWPDQSLFPEIVMLETEPPSRFKPSEWLLWNATTGETIPKVMGDIKLSA